MSSVNEIRQTFFQECDELLEALDDGLCEIDEGVSDASFDIETVNAVFRAVHSIKGGAAAFGLDELVHFAHQFETALDSMRSGTLVPTEDVMRVCHRAADHLNDLVAAGRDGQEVGGPTGADLIEKLGALVGASPASSASTPAQPAMPELPSVPDPAGGDDSGAFGFVPLGLDFGAAEQEAGPKTFDIRFVPKKKLYDTGNDPTLLFRELSEIGTLTSQVDTSNLPELTSLDHAESYLSWTLALVTEEDEQAIREVFEFVDGFCELDIALREPEGGSASTPDAPSATADDVTSATPEPVKTEPGPPSPPDTAPAATGATEPASTDAAARKGAAAKTDAAPKATVRVNLELVDRLINMVGELVINQAVLTQCVNDAGLGDRGEVATSLNEFRNLARDIQESVMAIRAQSVKPLFQRMARIVREASELAGKTVQFETEGETTEVDKTIIERLVDPLTHMIRNAVDHGLEKSEDRLAAGKTENGTVTLSAAHRSGRVLIEVSDDGAGINRERVFQIAADKGLIPADAVLKDSEIDNLLFLPGFSTAKKVSNLSGRGVGMDVVRSAIQKLGGRVNIISSPGKGTTMSISLPLTLAVLDGMVVDVAGNTMVVPITAIVETLRPRMEDIHPLGADATVVSVRNKLVPVIDLGVVFGHRKRSKAISEMVLLLIEAENSASWALAVDQIFDQRQVVIKGLESNYGHVPGVAAATILGDGNIALIIDPEETAHHAGPTIDPDDIELFDEVHQ